MNPFSALSADPGGSAALGDDPADGIIAALSVHSGLRVISRLSTSPSRRPDVRLPDIRSLLGASYVVFGQCTVSGRRVHVRVQLCRCITRPALADERVQLNAAGQVALTLKTPWRDGTTHLVVSPLEIMQRLARAGAAAKLAPHPIPRRAGAEQPSFRGRTCSRRSVGYQPAESGPGNGPSRPPSAAHAGLNRADQTLFEFPMR